MSAQKFFNKVIRNNGRPRVINIDKSGTNKMAIWSVNKRAVSVKKIKLRQCKYLNNIVEQDHRKIKRKIAPSTGFKDFESAQRTLSGIRLKALEVQYIKHLSHWQHNYQSKSCKFRV
jgi:putative transposase